MPIAPGRRIAVSALALTGFCCAFVGCSSSPTKGSEAPMVAAPAGATQLDACTLIPAADIQRLLGTAVPGKQINNSMTSECLWKDTATENSVTLHVGNAGTAPGNTLADHSDLGMPSDMMGKPGPDGMRLEGSGTVVFPAGDRENYVQVAVIDMFQAGTADAAGIELAKKVTPQIPQ